MEEYIYYNNLYDCYEKLLTDKQKKYFEDYYFENLSLSEIADTYHVSRNAVYKQLQLTIKKLIEYEEKLNLLKKKEYLENILQELDDATLKNKLNKLI